MSLNPSTDSGLPQRPQILVPILYPYLHRVVCCRCGSVNDWQTQIIRDDISFFCGFCNQENHISIQPPEDDDEMEWLIL